MKKTLHDGHRDRLRAKIAESGMGSLADHEKLEYLLFPFVPRRDTNPIAHELIETFGTLRRVLEADVESLTKVKGVSKNAALFLHSLPSLFLTYSTIPPQTVLKNGKEAAAYLVKAIGTSSVERFVCLFLDDGGALIRIADLASGAKRSVAVCRDQLIRLSLQCKAKILILGHNHPSGEVYPSREDVLATNRLAQALSLIGIRLWDHLVVSATESFSMFEHAMIGEPLDIDKPIEILQSDVVDWFKTVKNIKV